MHKPFNLAKGFAIDDLHIIFLGIMLNLLTFWFGVKNKDKPFSIRRKVNLLG